MKKVLWTIVFIPVLVFSQSKKSGIGFIQKGISFDQGLSWQEVLSKARLEKKYIFLDCYTTWCGLCKRMDKEIYPLETIGAFFNKHFISVKLQMDKTSRDNEEVKRWYAVADSIKGKYVVDAFPTYLFLSADGKPVHRAAGGLPEDRFLSLGADALDPGKQSYTLEAKYAEEKKFDLEKMSPAELKQMARSFKNSNPELAQKMALQYIKQLKDKSSFRENYDFIGQFSKNAEIYKIADSYINSLSADEMYNLFTKENFRFISHFMQKSNDRGFKFLYSNAAKIDSAMNEGYEYKLWYAWLFLNEIINKEEVAPLIKNAAGMPDWVQLYEKIKNKYNEYYAEMNVLQGKTNWYAKQKDWPAFTKHLVLYVDKYYYNNVQNSWYLNNYAWQIFQYSQDKNELAKAISWSEQAILYSPLANYMDTYSNLMYKMGRKKAAIYWQEVAVTIDPKNKDIQNNLDKMNKGERTWKEY